MWIFPTYISQSEQPPIPLLDNLSAYAISNIGRVYQNGKPIASFPINRKGSVYLYTNLIDRDGVSLTLPNHLLVGSTFESFGNQDKVYFIDGVTLNPAQWNLSLQEPPKYNRKNRVVSRYAKSLDDNDRYGIILAHTVGLSNPQISALFGCSEQTVIRGINESIKN